MKMMGADTHEKPGRIPGKKILILAGLIITVIIIATISAFLFFQSPENGNYSVSPSVTTSPSHQRANPVQHTTGSYTPVPATTFTVKETPRNPVDFMLQPGEQTSCGLTCRQLVAAITNTGSETAHNVCITVALHNSRNEVINLNGETSIRRCVGDISGGQEKSEQITINADCGVFATRCIGETLTLQTQVSSDEKTIQFPDQLIAV